MSNWIRLTCPAFRILYGQGCVIAKSPLLLPQRFIGVITNSVRTTNKPERLAKIPKGSRQAITLSDAAIQRIKELLSHQSNALGLRIGVRTRGCNGLSYTLTFCTEEPKGDEVVEQAGVKIFIDRRAQLTLLGSEMHFQKTLLASEFVFNNPNVRGTCGCGESFSV